MGNLNYEAPEHPHGESFPSSEMQSLHSCSGKSLFDHAFNFYAWYLTHEKIPKDSSPVFEGLSHLMQIAKISFQKGLFLTAEEEKEAVYGLSELAENLSNGFTKCSDIHHAIEVILKKLTDDNPRALLVSCLTHIEYKVCIHNVFHLKEEELEESRMLIWAVQNKISAKLPDLVVNTFGRNLQKLCKNLPSHASLMEVLQDCLKFFI